jgi:hypothetical protein
MELIIYLYTVIDDILMPFFRFPDSPLAGYYLGTFLLSLACVIIGEYSISLAFRFNKDRITRDYRDINHFQDLSIKALKASDKSAYKACNSIANDAYGKSFFSRISLSASSLWPVFIALGWMQYRFAGVEFRLPLLSSSLSYGYVPTFIVCYIATRILFGKIKHDLPFIKKLNQLRSG